MSVGLLKTSIWVRIMTFPTHFSYVCVIKQYIVCIFASGNSMNTMAQYKKVDHVVWICSMHSTFNLRPSLGVSVCSDTGVFVNHCWHCEEGRLRSGKECLLIIILGVSCQCQPCGEERESLQREAGRRRQWVWGSQPVNAFHFYSLHSPNTPVQPPKLWFAPCPCPF